MVMPQKGALTKAFKDVSPDDHPDLMTEAEYCVAFQKMAQDYFSGKQSFDTPEMLHLTGMPGAGKSTYLKKLIQERAIGGQPPFTVINFDDLRVYHPRYNEHVQRDPINAAARVNKSVERMIEWLFEEIAKKKINVLLDGSAMGEAITKADFAHFQKNGYVINMVILSVPPLVARQGVHLRFEEDYAAARAGKAVLPRWVESGQQDNAPAALVETVEIAEGGQIAANIKIVDRNGYGVIYSADQKPGDTSASAIIRRELARELTPQEQLKFQNNAERIASLMHQRENPSPPSRQRELELTH